MNTVSISQLKINPSAVLALAEDFPLAIENRNQIKAYVLGKDLYDKIVDYLEDISDIKAVKATNFSQGKDFNRLADALGL